MIWWQQLVLQFNARHHFSYLFLCTLRLNEYHVKCGPFILTSQCHSNQACAVHERVLHGLRSSRMFTFHNEPKGVNDRQHYAKKQYQGAAEVAWAAQPRQPGSHRRAGIHWQAGSHRQNGHYQKNAAHMQDNRSNEGMMIQATNPLRHIKGEKAPHERQHKTHPMSCLRGQTCLSGKHVPRVNLLGRRRRTIWYHWMKVAMCLQMIVLTS